MSIASRGTLLLVALLTLLPTLAQAQVQLSFPLGDYCKPGHYLPIQLTADLTAPLNQPLRLQLDNTIPIEFTPESAHLSSIFPALILQPPTSAAYRFHNEDHPLTLPTLHPVGDDQALIAYTGDLEPARRLAKSLFPTRTPLWIRRDSSDPLPGPAIAWESLDAIILDGPTTAALTNDRISTLLSAGVTIALHSDAAPASQWPWQSQDGYQILRHPPAGPRNLLYNEKAYEFPVAGWSPSWPAVFRKRIFLYAVLFSIATLTVATLRHRRAALLIIPITLATFFALSAWWKYQTPVQQRTGEIQVIDPQFTQHDTWIIQLSAGQTAARTLFASSLHPIFQRQGPADAYHLTLLCNEVGRPTAFDYQLPANVPLAFLSRTTTPGHSIPPLTPIKDSRLIELARSYYLLPSTKLTGESPSPTQTWPIIFLEKQP